MRLWRRRPGAYALAVVLVLIGYAVTAPGPAAADPQGPAVTLSRTQAGTGGPGTVSGTGWRPRALPEPRGGRLAVLGEPRLDGADGILTWFGAAPSRRLVLTVGNRGSRPVVDPVFRIGASRGVRAPRWEEQRWRGTVAPGGEATISLPVELTPGAHGDHLVSLRHDTELLAEHPWKVGRPWGVTLFWTLLTLVTTATAFRATSLLTARTPRTHRTTAPG
ncbi:hypothetical protein GCM10018785_33420 [Streptomyces longispororuber]|uniref:Uncharacterized protein n=1 Tax=Streptomyces longispororuber TaxID=68230 RepID=A0A919DN03_9ACTN|nr:hypothetical protein GCM10018785_33420 [Streptomyces longispororuber]